MPSTLYYGWWVSKDKDGMPNGGQRHLLEYSSRSTNGLALDKAGNLTALTGSATYAGHAAGKFAISNPLDGTGDRRPLHGGCGVDRQVRDHQ